MAGDVMMSWTEIQFQPMLGRQTIQVEFTKIFKTGQPTHVRLGGALHGDLRVRSGGFPMPVVQGGEAVTVIFCLNGE